MKISVITILSDTNYGSILQAYALVKYLEKNGFNVEVINYVPVYKSQSLIKACYRFIWKSILYSKRKKLSCFLKRTLQFSTIKYKKYADLKENPPVSDFYMVGSDQVWNSKLYFNGLEPAFFLDFVKKGKKVSFSSSIGLDVVSESELNCIKKYLSDFKSVAVREDSAIQLLNKVGIKNLNKTLDPVFLLSKKDYIDICAKTKFKNYLLIYNFEQGHELLNEVSRYIAKKLNLKIFEVGFAYKRCNSDKFFRNLSVNEFLDLLRNATYVVTTSFHGTAFSIIFEKNFYVIPPTKGPTRIESLLDSAGLLGRIIKNKDDFKMMDLDANINFFNSDSVIKKEIQASKDYLALTLDG